MYDAGMLLRLRWLILLAWAAAAIDSSLAAQPAVQTSAPVVALYNPGSDPARLPGPWQFHLGDNPAWAFPGVDDSTGHDGWQQISADAPWGAQGFRSYTGYAWYRIHLSITPGPQSGEYTLLAPRLESTAEVYWNGTLVARAGTMPPYPRWTYDDPEVEGDESPRVLHLGSITDGVLAVRVWFRPLWSYDDGLQGGFYKTPLLGSSATIAQYAAAIRYRQLRSDQYSYAMYTAYALLMVIGFIAWLRDRSRRAMLWLAVFCLGDFGIALFGFFQDFITFQTGYFWEQVFLAIRDIGLWYLLIWLLELHENRRLMRLTAILASIDLLSGIADGLLAFFNGGSPSVALAVQTIDALLTVPLVGLSLYSLVLVVLAARKRLDGPRWAVAIFAFATALLSDTVILLEQGRRFTHWTLSGTIAAPLFTIADNQFNARTLASTGLLLAIMYAIFTYVVESSRRQSAIAEEMRNAREVQDALIPQEPPSVPGFRIETAYRPAGDVGGDFYQVVNLKGDGVLVVVGDVSGKGMPAALTVSLLVGMVRTLVQFTQSPGEILAALNRRMLSRSHGGFTTCIILKADFDGAALLANAGHISPYKNGEEVALENGFPLGISGQTDYPEISFQLIPGDTLMFLSDGVVEARTPQGELLGFERTKALTRQSAEKVAETAQAFGQEDDITVLTIERLPKVVTTLPAA